MKSKTLFLLIICASFMVTTIETATCNNPIIYNNLNLPATINLAQLAFGRGFLPNKSIEINGVILARPNEFRVNLFEDGVMQQTADVPFHFKPLFRSNPTLVVRNNWIRNGGWGPQETFGGFPFKTNQPFILEFVAAEKNTIIININNQRFATFSRVDLSRISQLYVIGMNTIRVNTLTLCPNPVITTTTVRPTTTTEEPTTTTELTTTEEPTTTTTEEQTTTPLPTCPYPIVIPYPVIRNTWSPITGWEEEEHYGGFPFKIGEPFVLEFIAAPENTIIVNVDSQPFVNFSRDDLSKLSTLGVSSAIELSSVVLCHDKPITSTIEPTTTTEEQATTTEEPTTIEEPTTTTEEPTTTTEEPTTTTSKPTTTILPTTTTTKPPQYCPGQIVLNNLKIPATLDFVKLGFGTGFHFFSPKKRIIIFGTPLAQPTAFNINIGEPGKLLVNASVLFHFSPRFNENKVIRNTWIVGKGWGRAEDHGGFPFKVGEPFVLELYDGTDNYIDMKVNNKYFETFGRYNLKKVSQMEIEGGILVSSVILCPSIRPSTTTKSPTTTTGKPSTTLLPTTTPSKPPPFCPGEIVLNNLKTPAVIDFVKLGFGTGFNPPKRIIIFGTPLAQPNYFNIHIAEPANANVLFHFSARFGERQVIRNTRMIGLGWGRGEIHGGFPFKAGEPFVLEFVAGPRVIIHINVNNKYFTSFQRYITYRVSQMVIEGGIQLSSVILCK
uniref:Galectin domain-containing protein n=1 Tax=Meloidogyne enterolobii TaxID=390850 RepID=A0A6V7XZJ0_MELEN|nr:unnamed protein product [Meloidogyne enterolobii]